MSLLDKCGRTANCFSYLLPNNKPVVLTKVSQEADSKMGLDVQDIS